MPGIFEAEPTEMLQRVGLGTPDVLADCRGAAEARRGVRRVAGRAFRDARRAHAKPSLGGVMFELVHDER